MSVVAWELERRGNCDAEREKVNGLEMEKNMFLDGTLMLDI